MGALVISLTSIPPRYDQLPRVVAALRAQCASARVLLTLPRHYRRFPGEHPLPNLCGVEVLRPQGDVGPIAKVSAAARLLRCQNCHLLYCDDDWLPGPGWAQGFLDAARGAPEQVICASGFSARRLGLPVSASATHIAQGFAGVLIRPEWLDDLALTPPRDAWAVDDIWLSAHFARRGRVIEEMPKLRSATALPDPGNLQDATLDGANRAQANRRLAQHLAETYQIWGA